MWYSPREGSRENEKNKLNASQKDLILPISPTRFAHQYFLFIIGSRFRLVHFEEAFFSSFLRRVTLFRLHFSNQISKRDFVTWSYTSGFMWQSRKLVLWSGHVFFLLMKSILPDFLDYQLFEKCLLFHKPGFNPAPIVDGTLNFELRVYQSFSIELRYLKCTVRCGQGK